MEGGRSGNVDGNFVREVWEVPMKLVIGEDTDLGWVQNQLENLRRASMWCRNVCTFHGATKMDGCLSFVMNRCTISLQTEMQRNEGRLTLEQILRCIPYKYKDFDESSDEKSDRNVEVLMINSSSGPGLLFPKGGWENDETVEEAARREAVEEAGVRGDIVKFLGHYDFQSKTHQDEYNPEGKCKAAMFALHVNEELESWPEQSIRNRRWLTIPEAADHCRHPWMVDALVEGFSKWHNNKKVKTDTDTDAVKDILNLD